MRLNKEETHFLTKWTKVKQAGQWRYMLMRGLLWGIVVGAISHLIKVWDLLKAWDTAALADTYTSTDFFSRLFIYTAIGCGIHAYYWNTNTKRYNQLKKKERRAQSISVMVKE